jgi:hypothetical protein
LEREGKKFYAQYKNKLSKIYFLTDLNIYFSIFKIKIIQKGIKMLKEFHITIIPYPPTPKELNINKEINLVKTAILYADKVLLISIIPMMLSSMLYLIEQCGKEREMKQTIENIKSDKVRGLLLTGNEKNELELKLGKIQEYLKNNRINFKNISKEGFNKALRKLYGASDSAFKEIVFETGIYKLDPLIESGLLDIYTFGKSRILEETYPLLDENILNLVKAKINDEKLNILDVDLEKIKQIGFVFNIFQKLPNFENATIDEILDIRKTLGKPLIRFRSAIIEISDCIRYRPWDKGFYYDVEKLFNKKIEPALLEIDEECKSNRYLSKLLYTATKSSWEIPAGLGVIISKLAEVSNISATAIGLAIGAGTVAYKTLHEWKEKTKEIERNQIYFYYKTGKMLKK